MPWVFMEQSASIISLSTISSAIPFALVPSVSPALPLQIPWPFDSRSSSLCIKLCYWRFKHVFPPLIFAINLLVITALVSAPDIISSSTALSWPHGTEFADSLLKFTTFSNLSYYLSGDDQGFFCFSKDVPPAILQRLADVDYHKSLIADRMSLELRDSSNAFFFCIWTTTAQTLSHTVFERTHTDLLEEWFLAAFLLVCFKYDHPQWIYPHTARLSINWRKQRSSGHTLLSLARAVPQGFFTLSPGRSQWGGTVDFINLDMEKSRLYGIGSLMCRGDISINLKLLTMRRQ